MTARRTGDRTRYAYAVGRVRALETRLLDYARLQRLADARDAADTLRLLGESGFGGEALADLAHPADFERVLAAEARGTAALVSKLVKDKVILDYLGARQDYHNLKVLLKDSLLGMAEVDPLVPGGRTSVDSLRRLVRGQPAREVPGDLVEAMAAAKAAHGAQPAAFAIDTAIDRALATTLTTLAAASGLKYLRELTAAQLDLTNLKSLMRVKVLGKDRRFLDSVLLPGGNIPTTRLLALLAADLEAIGAAFATSAYARVVEAGVRGLAAGSLTAMEKAADEHYLRVAGRARILAMGPEPVVGYALARENELRNVRITMTGKLNGVPADVIRERLRDDHA
ncbi:MAG: V-type ATPase subunit [Bacillota bacterium]